MSRHSEIYDPNIPIVKLVSLGCAGVGKSQFLFCCNNNAPDPEKLPRIVPTIAVDFIVQVWAIDGKRFRIQMWDTAGEEKYRSFTPQYLRGAEVVLVFFDMTDRATFENIPKVWLKIVNEHRVSVGMNNVTVVLVGNKSDLEEQREVSIEEAETFAFQNDMAYVESTSFKRAAVSAVVDQAMARVARLHNADGTLDQRSVLAAKQKLELQQALKKKNCC